MGTIQPFLKYCTQPGGQTQNNLENRWTFKCTCALCKDNEKLTDMFLWRVDALSGTSMHLR
jgi:hypothetical protein